MHVLGFDELDEATGAKDGAPIELLASPLLSLDRIRVVRNVTMRRMRRDGWSVEVIAVFFNVSVRTVLRATRDGEDLNLAS